MPLPPLPASAVTIGAHAADWREAVDLAGAALARSGATQPGYAARMVQVIEEFGAYIVIAPGLALAHARPGPDVNVDGLAVVTLAEPVAFGHPHNDPVSVVIGLAVSTPDAHVTSVAELANVFNDPDSIPALADASEVAEVQRILTLSEEEAAR
ncbi:phosphotransferase system mannitol/fructose-specific IIA domain-containing protein [Leifsonia xyli subsp. cynodontis DSM 46306]|jgi:PTS system ascorbate-specific IIA component|uniref:Ascorbate-specific PTS system EIIA component n=1 Tax=Leifsonia xyli subsp. cynodontis DSM 46306 TaxID=1389489 RepID=U3P2W9_LEIXC|nr:PTS sugar transporter subunit IIA [Leifsonia xyli]AGW40670.1 phosphotransferase system mannitol/fructose-specific IIA domain-containing protein [Leifsonia xyli subsp. cynodontis DSM 46306]